MKSFKLLLCASAVAMLFCGSAHAPMVDGSYTGVGQGKNGNIAVQVDVKAGKLLMYRF